MAYTENLITIQQQVSNHLLLFHLLSCKYQCKELYLILPKYGVIPFEIRTLKKGHTEARRAQRFYKAEIVRHRGTVGAWRNRGYLRVLLMLWSTSLQSSGLQGFLKRLFQSYQQHVHYASVALCAFGTSVILSAFTSVLSPSLCDLLYVVGLLYHSKFRKNLLFLICTTNILFERLHQWHQYLFLQLFSINSGVNLISFDLK